MAAAERAVPSLTEARVVVDRFHAMLRSGTAETLSAWIIDASNSMLASFGRGVVSDRAAVDAAITSPWSNGQTEGKIT